MTTLCNDCHQDVYELREAMYMVTTPVWQAAVGPELLCIGCLEARLGRQLTAVDFTHAPVNEYHWDHSDRLNDRLKGKVFLPEHELPRALTIERYLDELGVGCDVEPLQTSPVAITACRVTFTRGDLSIRTVLNNVGWARRASAIERLDRAITLMTWMLRAEKWSSGMKRMIRRRAGRAEVVMQSLFTPSEREHLRDLFEISTLE